MTPLITEELPYCTDSSTLFEQLKDLQQPVFLDSSYPFSQRGRYDIISAQPLQILKESQCISKTYREKPSFFSRLQSALESLDSQKNNPLGLPFIGGAIGYFGYDLGRQVEQLPSLAHQDRRLPEAIVGIYSWAIIIDHHRQHSLLVSQPQTDLSLLKDIRQRLKTPSSFSSKFKLSKPFEPCITKQQYQAAFTKVKQYILAGDCYQINLAQRFSAEFNGDPWQAYKQLRPVAAAPFSAYLGLEEQAILSMSPERFLHFDKEIVSTSPIKGTIKRDPCTQRDNQLAQQLLSSTKDRAENLMIVDLLRNDIGRSCQPGSINVESLFELQSFETVHHLVSTITGKPLNNTHPVELLANCFPGGSITGAPKVRAMEIIEELEPFRRSIYCGSIGYISHDQQMDTNIAIRTLACEGQTIDCWAGGGIVADSNQEEEYQESLTKIKKLLAALN